MRRQLISLALGLGVPFCADAAAATADSSSNTGSSDSTLALQSSTSLGEIAPQKPPIDTSLATELHLRLSDELGSHEVVHEVAHEARYEAATDPVRLALLDQARLWQARNRNDFAAEAISKLLRFAPDDADGLALQAFIQINANQVPESKETLAHLRRVNPHHADIVRIEALQKLEHGGKEKLRQVRMLAEAGKPDQALARMHELFPDGPPTGDLALEYWEIVADTENGWEAAYAGLKALLAQAPDNLRYRLAFADHKAIRRPDDPEVLKTIEEISKSPNYQAQARSVWRHTMLRLAPNPESIPLIEHYLAGETLEDTAVKDHLNEIKQILQQQHAELTDPFLRARRDGLALLSANNLTQAERRLNRALEGRPTDPDVLGGLGLLRMRQGRHIEAQAYFLRAQKNDPQRDSQPDQPGGRWAKMARTAHYWGLIREAGDASDAGNFALAEERLHKAHTLDANEPEAMIALGKVYLAQGHSAQAEQALREALHHEPGNVNALQTLLSLYVGAGREQAATDLIAHAKPGQRAELIAITNTLHASLLKQKAEKAQAQGDIAQAIAAYEQAANYDADDPWLRLDLARLYAGRGELQRGEALFDALLPRHANSHHAEDAAARYAYALFLSGQAQTGPALTALDGIGVQFRNDDMRRLQRRLWIGEVIQHASTMHQQEQDQAAQKLLDAAQVAVGADLDLTLDVIDARIDAKQLASARTQLIHLADTETPSIDWRLRYARLAQRIDAYDLMQAQLPSLDASQLSAEQAQTLDDMKVNLALHEVEILRNKNELDWALQLLAQWRQSHPDNVQILYAQAQTLRTAGKREQAAENYQLLLAQKPDDHRAAIALIEIQVDLHENDDARHGITAQLLDLNGVTEDQMADLISAQIDLQDYADAKQLTATALGINPNSPRALADASQLARRDGDLPKAIDYLQHSLASDAAQRSATGPAQLSALRVVQNPDQPTTPEAELEATPTSASELTAAQSDHYSYRRLAEMLDQHTDWFFSAFDRHSRSGTQGISEYDATEIPLAWERAQGPGGRWTFHVDLEQINAGILNLADSGNAASFGSVLLCQPQCNSGTFNQSASGVAFNASLQRDNVRYDIGTSPLGFPVKTIVGGILVKGDLGPLGYSFDMSRRPVTGNLLSYAGVADPRTGQTWGGVDATGVRLGLSLDSGGRYGWWSSLGLHDLNGENVKGNLRLQLMTGGTLRLINEDDLLLQLGLTGMVWRFRQNVGQYTFGDGGYYSPQRYESLSLPVTFGARYARLSFSMRASISSSYSETNAAPYFPTDAAMQAAAQLLSTSNGTTPIYSGGPSHGVGRSFALTGEYQLLSQLFFGTRFELDRSVDYAPNRFVVYVRYALDHASAQAVNFLPEPFVSPAQY